jgi:parallel beta-helix repeat protein
MLSIPRTSLAAALVALVSPLARAGGTCVPLTDGMVVTTDVKICPGTYFIADPEEDGVIRVGAPGVAIDLTGVVLIGEGKGWGIRSQVFDAVSVLGGSIQGYRAALLFEGGQGHLVQGCDLSFNRKRPVQNGPGDFLAVWPDFAGQMAADQIGDGVVLVGVSYATVRDCRMSYQQNGIGLFQSSFCVIADNDCSYNQGWGIHLRRSSDNQILSNRADRCFNKASSWCHAVQQDGCDSAALLLIKASDRNLVSGNALRDSGDGVFSAAQEGATFWGTSDNRYERNDCRFAKHIGIEATFSDRNVFERNDVSGAGRYGFWLGYSRDPRVRSNRIEGCKLAGISNESVQRARYESNRIALNATGVELRQGTFDLLQQDSRDHVFVDNRIVDNSGVGLRSIDTHVVRAERNVLASNTGGNLRVALALAPAVDGPLTFKGNDILLGAAPWNVSNEQATEIDLRWNWWGTTDPLAISTTIKGLEQYALIPPHAVPRLEIDFLIGSDGPWVLRRVVNERAGNALDTAAPLAVQHGNDLLDLRLGVETSLSGAPPYTTGLHFRDIWLPADATLLGARLVLPTHAGSDPLALSIAAEAADDAAPFGEGTLPATRPTTQASVAWDVSVPWSSAGWATSPDVTALVAEVLARPGWKAGNALALIVRDVGSTGWREVLGFAREGYATLAGMPYEFRRYRKHRFMKLEARWSSGPLKLVIERELGASADDADTCTSCNEVHLGLLGGPQTGGFRFEDVRVQPGTALDSAALIVPTDGTYTNPLQLRLWGEALVAPPPYGPGSLPSNRPKTSASVAWPVTNTWQYLEWHATPDVAALLAEVLAQPGWSFGGEVAIDVTDDGSSGHRRVWAFDRDPRVSPHDFPQLGATPFKPFLTAPVHP